VNGETGVVSPGVADQEVDLDSFDIPGEDLSDVAGQELDDITGVEEPDVAGQELDDITGEDADVAGQNGSDKKGENDGVANQEDEPTLDIETLQTQVRGFQNAALGERTRRQLAETQVNNLTKEINKLKGLIKKAEMPDIDPEGLVTGEDLKRYLASLEGGKTEVEEPAKETPVPGTLLGASKEDILEMETKARERHSDYDEVVNKYTRDIIFGNPALGIPANPMYIGMLEKSYDKAETAYKIGCSHDAYLDKLQKASEQRGRKQVTENIKKATKKSPTLGKAGDSANADRIKAMKIRNMTPEERAAHRRRVKGEE